MNRDPSTRRWIRAFVPGLAGLAVLASALSGDPQSSLPKPPQQGLPGNAVPDTRPRIEEFDTMSIDCVVPEPTRPLLHFRVTGASGVLLRQEGGKRMSIPLPTQSSSNSLFPGAIRLFEASGVPDPHANARVTGYTLVAFSLNEGPTERRVPIRYLENLQLTLKDEVTRTRLSSAPTGKRIRYSVPALYGRLDKISALYRQTPPVSGAGLQPRVAVTSSPSAAGIPPGERVEGALTFELVWEGLGWERLEAAAARVDFMGERELCGTKSIGPVSAAVK